MTMCPVTPGDVGELPHADVMAAANTHNNSDEASLEGADMDGAFLNLEIWGFRDLGI